jgi:DNA-binding beta-propeller fold protein YncE
MKRFYLQRIHHRRHRVGVAPRRAFLQPVLALTVILASPAPATAQTAPGAPGASGDPGAPGTTGVTGAGLPPFGVYLAEVRGLRDPWGVAIAADGRVYIADRGHDRIAIVDSATWSVVAAWENAGLRSPAGLALDGNGGAFIVDSGHHRMVHLDAAGSVIRAWGMRGAAPGQFNHPVGVAADAERVCIADAGNHRVQVFDRSGTPLHLFGEHGREPGRFIRPSAIALGAAGSILVADTDNHRIQRFGPTGQHLQTWGDQGPFPGLFAEPLGIAVHDGMAYIADSRNHRIQAFDERGKVLYEWGLHAVELRKGAGRFETPTAIAISPDGRFAVVSEWMEDRLQVFGRVMHESQRPLPAQGYEPVLHYGPRIDIAGEYFAATEPDAQMILVLDHTCEQPIMVTRFGGYGRKVGEFNQPHDVELDPLRGLLFISDPPSRRIACYRLEREPGAPVVFLPFMSKLVRAFDLAVLDAGPAKARWPTEPAAIEVDREGRLYVLDPVNARIVVMDDQMQVTAIWRGSGSLSGGTSDGSFVELTDMAFDPSGEVLYVVDTAARPTGGRVIALDRAGHRLAEFGGSGGTGGIDGAGESSLARPWGVAVDASGDVLVTDTAAHQVVRFDSRGRFIRRWGGEGTDDGRLFKPRGIACDNRGRVIVIDFGNHRGQVYDGDGNFIAGLGAWGRWIPPKQGLSE